MNNRVNCDKCGKKVASFKKLKKVNEGYLCADCIRENRAKRREFLRREVLGIRKREDLMKEWAEKREARKEEQERLKKMYGEPKPKIKSIKPNKIKISTLGIYVTKNEKLFLYKKLTTGKDPLTSEEANERIKLLSGEMLRVKEEIKEELKLRLDIKKPQEEFKKRFDEEFAKLAGGLK